jgi:hypothetical protein
MLEGVASVLIPSKVTFTLTLDWLVKGINPTGEVTIGIE